MFRKNNRNIHHVQIKPILCVLEFSERIVFHDLCTRFTADNILNIKAPAK